MSLLSPLRPTAITWIATAITWIATAITWITTAIVTSTPSITPISQAPSSFSSSRLSH